MYVLTVPNISQMRDCLRQALDLMCLTWYGWTRYTTLQFLCFGPLGLSTFEQRGWRPISPWCCCRGHVRARRPPDIQQSKIPPNEPSIEGLSLKILRVKSSQHPSPKPYMQIPKLLNSILNPIMACPSCKPYNHPSPPSPQSP